MKTCPKCLAEKPVTEFYPSKTSKDGLQWACKSCAKARTNAARAENVEAARVAERAKYHANPGAAQARTKAWRVAHAAEVAAYKKAYRAAHREESKAHIAKWTRENPAKRTATQMRRHAGKLQATPAWADHAEIARIYAAAAFIGYQVDHIVPLRSKLVSGLHCEANLQLLSAEENLAKSNRHWPEMPA